MKTPITIEAEKLAGWYFRLNGFLTIPNFIVHEDARIGQRTEIDIFGVRFPNRAELRVNSLEDHALVANLTHKALFVIAEVKAGDKTCNINPPWLNPEKENMERVLNAVGIVPPAKARHAAKGIYASGLWEDHEWYVTLLCVGGRRNRELEIKLPGVPQLLWDDLCGFIYRRFRTFWEQKQMIAQWEELGQLLVDLAGQVSTPEAYREAIMVIERAAA